MTIRDSKGKFAKATPFKAGDRVRLVKKTSPLSDATPVKIGFLGTILGGIRTYDDGTYRCDVTFDKTGSTPWATRCSDLCLADAPAAPEVVTAESDDDGPTRDEIKESLLEYTHVKSLEDGLTLLNLYASARVSDILLFPAVTRHAFIRECKAGSALAEVARLKAELDLQKRIAEAALFREKAEARRAVAAESKLSDIAVLIRANDIFRSMGEDATFASAIDFVLARK